MAIITPVGKMNFDWSPEESTKVVKTASANGKTKTVTDKDLLYLAAKKVIQAQFDESEAEEKDADKDESADESVVEDVVEVDVDDTDAEVEDEDAEVEVEIPDAADAGEESAIVDVQEAVAELVDKSEAADAVVDAVTVALDKVNQAVEEVRSAVGAAAGSEEVVSDDVVTDEIGGDVGGDVGGDDEVFEIEISDETACPSCGGEKPFGSDPDSCCKEEEGGEDIIQESTGVACASVKKALQKEAGADDFVKTSKISPTTRKKVLKFWKDDLGYAADYAKLMVTDYEK